MACPIGSVCLNNFGGFSCDKRNMGRTENFYLITIGAINFIILSLIIVLLLTSIFLYYKKCTAFRNNHRNNDLVEYANTGYHFSCKLWYFYLRRYFRKRFRSARGVAHRPTVIILATPEERIFAVIFNQIHQNVAP